MLVERGRIEVEGEVRAWLRQGLAAMPLRDAPLTRDAALLSGELDLGHQDPADRFIVATALAADLTLLTADQRLLSGPARTLPAAD